MTDPCQIVFFANLEASKMLMFGFGLKLLSTHTDSLRLKISGVQERIGEVLCMHTSLSNHSPYFFRTYRTFKSLLSL